MFGLWAIIVGKSAAGKDADYFRVRRPGSSLQNRRAIEIASKLGFNFDEKIGIKEIKIIEEYLKNYQLIVIDGDAINEIIYIGPQKEKKIMLYHHNQHFDTIKSLPGFFSKKNYCFKCMKCYNNFSLHPCNNVCKNAEIKNVRQA